MKKLILLSMLATLAACTHGTTHDDDLVGVGARSHHSGGQETAWGGSISPVEVTDSTPKIGEVRGATGIDRSVAQAGEIRWVEDSKAINVGPGGGTANILLTPRQIQTYQQAYLYTCDKYAWGEGLCQDWVCTGGKGKSELWDKYYNGGGDRVASLDQALRGVSQSAGRLHRSGIFNTKARSWQEFRQRMNQALRQDVITANEYGEVFGTWGDTNRINLGYAGNDCHNQSYRCEYYGLFTFENGCQGTRTVEKTLNVLNRPVNITFKNPQLQSFETETVTVIAGPDYDSIRFNQPDKTQYNLLSKEPTSDGGAVMVLEGQNRALVPLPEAALQGIRFNDSAGNNMNAVVAVDPRFIGTGDDKLMVKLQVTYCEAGKWYNKLGDCKGNDKKAKVVSAPAYHRIAQATSSFALPSIPAGSRVWVSYSIQRENSRFYNNSPVAGKETKLSDLKK